MDYINFSFLTVGVAILIVDILAVLISYSKKQKPKKSITFTVAVVALLIIVFSQAFTIIPTGHTGVRTTFGQVSNNTVPNGFNWQIPFVQNIELINNKQQDIKFEDDEIWSETSLRTPVFYSGITVTYQINPEKSSWIFANISDYQNNLVTNELVSSSVKSSSKQLIDEDATNRSKIEPLVSKIIQKNVDEKYGESVVYISKVTINNADFEESYNNALAEKQKAQLEAEKQAIINQQNIDKAEADKKAAITKAEADAEAKKIAANAEAEANSTLEKSLSDKVLRDKYISKWNGELPDVMSGENSSVLFSLDKQD
ncbi:MAG: hypothetical protein MJ089_04685 [Ruminococcus sp.]|nr:hypothetical protein [Ruminococcus sp.]